MAFFLIIAAEPVLFSRDAKRNVKSMSAIKTARVLRQVALIGSVSDFE